MVAHMLLRDFIRGINLKSPLILSLDLNVGVWQSNNLGSSLLILPWYLDSTCQDRALTNPYWSGSWLGNATPQSVHRGGVWG